ncbi:MAG: AEC family transporter [Cardiobacteriaceae bacterium]|nr:AEC family transporter [Cardiobacteriaceae bacterium]
MQTFWAGMGFSLNIVLPILAIIILGKWMSDRGAMSRAFIDGANHLLYFYAIPCLIFFGIVKSDVSMGDSWRLLLAGYLAVFSLFSVASWLARRHIREKADRGVFVQGVFRGNLAILGVVLVREVYGAAGLSEGAMFAGTVAFLLNVLAIITFSADGQTPWRSVLLKILRNPLFIGIVSAITIKALAIPLPKVVLNFGSHFVGMTLPLALLCTGASLNLHGIFGAGQVAIWASIGRLIVSPVFFVGFGYLCGVEGRGLGILFLMGAAPAASVGFVMALAMGGNAAAAANIIAITTACSAFIIAPGIALLHVLGWV